MRKLLCLVEPWNIFTVTQVHETGVPLPVSSTLNIFHDFAPLTGSQYNYIHSCDHLIAAIMQLYRHAPGSRAPPPRSAASDRCYAARA